MAWVGMLAVSIPGYIMLDTLLNLSVTVSSSLKGAMMTMMKHRFVILSSKGLKSIIWHKVSSQ